jgi:branched-chain amino acid transport system substrate-binding protein
MKSSRFLLAFASAAVFVALSLAPTQVAAVDEIKWGIIIDLSGPTAGWGKTQLKGQEDAARWMNEHGGINGKTLKLLIVDDSYKVKKAAPAYRDLVRNQKVLGLYLQSSGATMALAPDIKADGVATVGASFVSPFQDPSRFPYSFFAGPSYATMCRIVLKWIRDTWTISSRKPRICFLYPPNTYGTHYLPVARNYASEIGVDIVGEQDVPWPTKDPSEALMAIADLKADFAYLTSTAKNGAVVLRYAKELGIKPKFICNIRTSEESLIPLSLGAAEGVYGVQCFAPYGANVPGMKKIVESHEKWRPGETGTNVYVEGWVNILVVAEALRRADKAANLTPRGIKEAFETLRDFDTGGLAPPITFTKKDHRASLAAKIYQVKNGKFVDVSGWVNIPRDFKYFGE